MMEFSDPTWRTCKHGPRRWQAEAFDTVRKHYATVDAKPGVIGAIMGAGKSVVIDEICATSRTKDLIVVSTSTQLLTQDLYDSISRRCNGEKTVGVWYGKRKKLGQVIVVCNDSVPQLAEKIVSVGKRVALWIADEAHKSETDALLKAKPLLNPQDSIGFTATPYRSCPKETISLFQTMLYRYGAKDAIADKVVVPWSIVNWNAGIDSPDDLDNACIEMISGSQGPGLCNSSGIKDAEEFAGKLSASGIKSLAVHSRLDMRTVKHRLELLRHGDLRCIVHVNLLAEGANYPFFRWLCMRREVGARVRFLQEIGRLLRSDEGKEKAIFYDPHDLFGAFNLTYAEALGDREQVEEEEKEVQPREFSERLKDADPPLAMYLIESMIRTLVIACDMSGIMPNRRPVKKADRVLPSTSMQSTAIQILVENLVEVSSVPDGWKIVLQEITKHPGYVRYGFAADLILALSCIRNENRWPDSLLVDGSIAAVPFDAESSGVPLVLDKTGQYVADFGKVKS